MTPRRPGGGRIGSREESNNRAAGRTTKGETMEINHTTRAEIRQKLAAHAALTLLHYSQDDPRGRELAEVLEREAHALWQSAGLVDCPTFELSAAVAESYSPMSEGQ